MRSQWEDITAVQAVQDLEDSECGRDLIPDLAERYSRDMINKNWHETNHGPAYDTRGILVDGQHRYKAVALAAEALEAAGRIRAEDFSVRMWVTREMPAEAFRYLDGGKPRSYTSLLQIDGIPNSSVTVPIMRRAVKWEAGLPWTRTHVATTSELDEFLKNHPEIIPAAEYAKNWHAPVLASTMAGFCWWLLGSVDLAAAEFFMESLRKGSIGDEKHPVHILRERLIRDRNTARARGSFMRQEAVLWLVIRAWNSYRTNEGIKKLQLPELKDITDRNFIRPR
jgi:hypothetical protein